MWTHEDRDYNRTKGNYWPLVNSSVVYSCNYADYYHHNNYDVHWTNDNRLPYDLYSQPASFKRCVNYDDYHYDGRNSKSTRHHFNIKVPLQSFAETNKSEKRNDCVKSVSVETPNRLQLVYDYNHSNLREKRMEMVCLPKSRRNVNRDPRITQMITYNRNRNIKCENPKYRVKRSIKCEHGEKESQQSESKNKELPQFANKDVVMRENKIKQEILEECELMEELKEFVILRESVPVITKPADFSNYKIPRKGSSPNIKVESEASKECVVTSPIKAIDQCEVQPPTSEDAKVAMKLKSKQSTKSTIEGPRKKKMKKRVEMTKPRKSHSEKSHKKRKAIEIKGSDRKKMKKTHSKEAQLKEIVTKESHTESVVDQIFDEFFGEDSPGAPTQSCKAPDEDVEAAKPLAASETIESIQSYLDLDTREGEGVGDPPSDEILEISSERDTSHGQSQPEEVVNSDNDQVGREGEGKHQQLLELIRNVVDAKKLEQIESILLSEESPPEQPVESFKDSPPSDPMVLEQVNGDEADTLMEQNQPEPSKCVESESNETNTDETGEPTQEQDVVVPQTSVRDKPQGRMKRKRELELLQEDVNKNFHLLDVMNNERNKSPKSAGKQRKAATPKINKRVGMRRKSIATITPSTLVTLSNASSEPAKKRRQSFDYQVKPLKIRRRDSMSSAFTCIPTIDICNDDPYHDIGSTNCRLCTTTRTEMALHYIEEHPNFEVYCCRPKLATARRIKSSAFSALVSPTSASYECLLCEHELPLTSFYSFYHHLAQHTGEFYHKCLECNFRDVTFDESHARIHKFEIFPFPDVVENSIRGWMCDCCHFVQLHKHHVQSHIEAHHLNTRTTPKCVEFSFVAFGSHKIAALDFDELDHRFKEEPIFIEENSVDNGPLLDDDADQAVAGKGTALKILELKTSALREIRVEVPDRRGRRSNEAEVTIQNVKYNPRTKYFSYSRARNTFQSLDFEDMINYLSSLGGAEWSGACYECDPLTTYSDVQPVVMELHHLRNAHWHLRDGSSLSSAAPPSDPCGHNVLRPWMTTPCAKTAHARNELLTLAAILSTYKCMFSPCSFYTNNLDRMSAHLDQHEAELNTMDLDEVDEGIECAYCSVRVNNQSSYFMHIQTEHNACRYYCPYCFYRSNESNMMEHLKWYHGDRHQFMLDGQYDGLYTRKELDNEHMFRLIKRNVKPFECPECAERFYPLDMFQLHLDQHDNGYFCKLCQKTLPVDDFYVHISEHERGPFECIYCPYGAPDGPTIKRHLADKHANEPPYVCVRYLRDIDEVCNLVDSVRLCPLSSSEDLAALPIKVISKQMFDLLESTSRFETPEIMVPTECNDPHHVEPKNPTYSGPNKKARIDKLIAGLPMEPLFERPLNCVLCPYNSKMRLNLIRHLRLHLTNPKAVQYRDPLNVIPINNNSNSPVVNNGSPNPVQIPQFVPTHLRFRCGSSNCSYLAINERSFRIHMEKLHHSDPYFTCVHCEEDILNPEHSIKVILDHYRLHDKQLYKCQHCDYVANTLVGVSKHSGSVHLASGGTQGVIKIREEVSEPRIAQRRTSVKLTADGKECIANNARKDVEDGSLQQLDPSHYKCTHCPFATKDRSIIEEHNLHKHKFKTQFECGLCNKPIGTRFGFKRHIHNKHHSEKCPPLVIHYDQNNSENNMMVIQHNPREDAEKLSENEGSLATAEEEATNESAKLKGVLKEWAQRTVSTHTSQIRSKFRCEQCLDIYTEWGALQEHNLKRHGVPNYTPKIPNFLTFVCYHCPFSTQLPRMLAQHHSIYHDNLPLLFRVNYVFKCAYCDFCGILDRVQKHCEDQHKAEPLAICHVKGDMCGQCEFKYKSTDELRNHFRRAHKTVANPALTVNEKLMKRLLNLKLIKTFWCEECKVPLNSYQYSIHEHRNDCVLTEERQWFLCRTCPRVMDDRDEAMSHMKKHFDRDRITCPKCLKTYANLRGLVEHVRRVHGKDQLPVEEIVSRYKMEIVCPNGLVVINADLSARALAVLNGKA